MKNRKIQNYEIIEANNKNQVVGEYVWMISNAISEFVHSTTSNRKKNQTKYLTRSYEKTKRKQVNAHNFMWKTEKFEIVKPLKQTIRIKQ